MEMNDNIQQINDPVTKSRIESIANLGFKRLYEQAIKCSNRRGGDLSFYRVNEINEIRAIREGQSFKVFLRYDLNDSEFEHHAAHELCHIIAGCCGFSYNIEFLNNQLWQKCDSGSGTEEECAIVDLQRILGSFLTHCAVHKLLQVSGYISRNWDDYLIQMAQNTHDLENSLSNRLANVGWMIQYEELDKLGLPGLDVNELRVQLRRLISTFDNDYQKVRTQVSIAHLLDVDGCLASTRSLADSFGKFINYPIAEALSVNIAFTEYKNCPIESIINQLQSGN